MPDVESTPTVEEDLNEGFKISEVKGSLTVIRTFLCKDLIGANAVTRLSSALKLTNGGDAHSGPDIPKDYETLTVNGKTLWVQSRELTPWPPADAIVTVNYAQIPRDFSVAGFAPTVWETGSAAESGQTDFDWTELNKAFNARTPIFVDYTPSGGTAQKTQNPSVPILYPKSGMVATREESDDPQARADLYVAKTNKTLWRGNAPNTVLCMSIKGRNPGTGIWTTTYVFAKDPLGLFHQIARWVDPVTGKPPKLLPADLAAGNGIKDIVVQGEEEFADLAL